jgi:hypothetical protein
VCVFNLVYSGVGVELRLAWGWELITPEFDIGGLLKVE